MYILKVLSCKASFILFINIPVTLWIIYLKPHSKDKPSGQAPSQKHENQDLNPGMCKP